MFNPDLFRPEAIKHYMSRQQDGVPVPMRIAPAWTWWIFWSLFSVIILGLFLSIISKVEVRSTGRGIFHIASGARSVIAQTSGIVSHTAVTRGQQVKTGDLLIELESATLQAQLLEVERAIEQYYKTTQPAQQVLDKLAESQIEGSISRYEIQKEQLISQENSIKLFERRLVANEELNKHGLVSTISLEESREALAQAIRSLNSAKQSLMASEQEISSARARLASDRLRNQQEIQNLTTKRDALAYSISLTRITAIESGTIEGLHIRNGDVISSGQVLGRILPDSNETTAIALLSETDRAHVKPGDAVRLEVDQYPKTEWGSLTATIHRIADSPASPSELRDIFGETIKPESSYIVELRFPPDQKAQVSKQPMQNNMGFQANFILKRQRPIVFILEPLRRWLE